MTLQRLLMISLGARADEIVCPRWMKSELYTITAILPPRATKEMLKDMLNGLLVERFSLKLHHETRTFPVYELRVASSGPKLSPSRELPLDDSSSTPVSSAGARIGDDGFPELPHGVRQRGAFSHGIMRSRYRAYTLAELAAALGPLINIETGASILAPPARVVDMTGMPGAFDFTLEFRGMPAPVAGNTDGAFSSDAPGLFQALQAQLGLKLVKGKPMPFDIIVLDSANQNPTEN